MKIPLSTQLSYMERHRDKGRELVKTKPETQAAVDIAEGILLTLTAYAAFETEIRQRAQHKEKSQWA